MAALRSVLLVLAAATVSAQEIISADQGGSAPATGQPAYASHPVRHASAGYMSEADYNRGMTGSTGAGSSTVWIMMATVSIGYMLLFGVLISSCCYPATRGLPFQRFPELPPGSSLENPGMKLVVAEMEPVWRKAFVGKVYSLLVAQIALTLVIVFCMMTFGGYNFYVWSMTDGAWTRLAAILTTLVIVIAMVCTRQAFPMNIVLLFTFTAAMSYTVGTVCTMYAAMGMTMLVVEAFAITSLIFIALTIFTMQSKIDFSFLGLVLPVLLFTFIIWGFFAMFAFPTFAFSQVYALAGTLIFCLYVLYDTWMITTMLSYDEYVLATINLYLDFVNLFLFILQLLVGMRRD